VDNGVSYWRHENRRLCTLTSGHSALEGQWRCFENEERAWRDRLNMDILWLRNTSMEDAESLPEPDVLAQEIPDDLELAIEQFAAIANPAH
jgi:hypothetical protein